MGEGQGGQTAQTVGGGAATGAAAGSVFGPIGTVVGLIAGAALGGVQAKQQAAAISSGRGASQRAGLFNIAAQKRGRERDILALRRDPFIQAAGTRLFSEFTNLSEGEAQAFLRKRAASESPFLETRTTFDPRATARAFAEGVRGQALRDIFEVTPAEKPGVVTPDPFASQVSNVGSAITAGGLQAIPEGGAGPERVISIQNTDIITQSMLQRLASQEQAQASRLLTRTSAEFGEAQAARGVQGAIPTAALLGAAGRELQSGVSQRAAEREFQAAAVNRQALLDIVSQFEEFGSLFEGTFT